MPTRHRTGQVADAPGAPHGDTQMDTIQPANENKSEKQQGKVGMAILLWMLGVPGGIVLLYLLFAH
jgi:hypothetical protein